MAFLVLLDILPPERYSEAIGDYPRNDYGAPLFWPFFEFSGRKRESGLPHGDYYGDGTRVTKRTYHNNSIWPFANTLFDLAQYKSERNKEILLRTLGDLSRFALVGNFAELMDYETGGWKVKHARSYIWSASAYLAVIFKMIAGIDLSDAETITFRPFVPEELGPQFRIEGLQVDGMKLDVLIDGNGGNVRRFSIDGVADTKAVLTRDDGHHIIKIGLGNH
jgi:hypothetical protein